MNNFEPHKSSMGLDANIVMLIAYFGAIILSFIPGLSIIAWAVPLAIFFIEKDSKYVKFHAMQSILLEAVGLVFSIILGIIIAILTAAAIFSGSGTAIGFAGFTTIITLIVPILMFIFSIIAAIKGWKYECYKIPVIGNWAEKITFK